MAGEYRRPIFNLSGVLTVGCSATDTQLSSSIFASLPTDYSTGSYLPLLVANDTTGKAEIVWVVGHSTGSAAVTVLRGMEGTTPQQWSAGDVVRCSPTLRDSTTIYVSSVAALPSDAHIGCVAAVAGKGLYRRTEGGWMSARRSLCIVRLSAGFNYTTNLSDVFAQGGWSSFYDPDGAVYLGTAAGDYSYVTIPETRNYDILYKAGWKPSAAGAVGTKVTRNSRDVNASVASDVRATATLNESWCDARRESVPLVKNDKLYWSNWANVNGAVQSVLYGVPTELVIRYSDTVG